MAASKDQIHGAGPQCGKLVHIRYFAVSDDGGAYRGCLEIGQDVSGIRSLEGERRLLDWE